MADLDAPDTLRFADCELDARAFRLLRQGRVVHLERLPMDLLLLLVRARGRLVTRHEIVARLWGKQAVVDVEAGINTAVRKIRRALGDRAGSPALIDTVPGSGYRFAAEVVAQTATTPSTLAVLPFDNLSAEAELDWLAAGFTEEVIAALGQLGGSDLHVIGRTSTLRLRSEAVPLADAARRLGADHLLEGSVRADAHRLVITCRIVRTGDQAQVWTGSYERARADLLGLQRELCRDVAQRVRGTLAPARLSSMERRQPTEAAAYDLYLRGVHAWNQLTPPTTRHAIECFAQAVQLDPDFALAWSGLADARSTGPITSDAPPHVTGPLAVLAATRAVAADPTLPETQTSIGVVKFWLQWDWAGAEAHLRRAVELGPNYAYAHRMLSHVLSQTGRHAEASVVMRRAREIDPLYVMHLALSAQLAYQARDVLGAATFAKQALAIDAGSWIAHFQLAQVCAHDRDLDGALRSVDQSLRIVANSKALALKGWLLARSGKTDAARDLLAALEAASGERYLPPCARALVHLGLGEIDAAFESLQQALVQRDIHLVFLPVDPKWDELRADARFQSLLRDCGFSRS